MVRVHEHLGLNELTTVVSVVDEHPSEGNFYECCVALCSDIDKFASVTET